MTDNAVPNINEAESSIGGVDVLGGLAPEQVRVRFPPSPTGNLHVGNVRSALFNYAFARHFGGTFVLRIEDTDAARSTEESMRGVLDSLEWLGLDWDEGPLKGGPHGPYLQSQRREIYDAIIPQLVEGGYAYPCFCTREETEAREAERPKGSASGYDGFCRGLSAEEVSAKREQGLSAVVRMKVPEGDIEFDDLVRGPVSFNSKNVPDYVIVRANGDPLYTLVNPVDDSLMEITHVLRGEDLLSSTPRQIVLYRALNSLGVGSGRVPVFGHLPIVMGDGNRRLSKRDEGSGLAEYRERGFLPEGLLNYLALLGWAIAEDRDVFTLAEMCEAFDIRRVNANPARFDPRKCLAINADHIRMLDDDELAAQVVPFLTQAGLISHPPTAADEAMMVGMAPIVRERINTLSEIVELTEFLFLPDDAIRIEEKATLKPEAEPVLGAAASALTALTDWSTPAIEEALRASLVEGLGLKPRLAFGPLRTAVSGKRISPPLFESMELLGQNSTLARLAAARAGLAA